MKYILLIMLSFNVSAQDYSKDYWMPRETLKNKLNIYQEKTSKSHVICAVGQGRAMKKISTGLNWLKVSISLCEGYVYKKSIVPFEQDFTYVQGLAADEIEIHRVNNMMYFYVGGWCYFVNLDNLKDIPQGKDNAITLRTHINNIGGLDNLTDEIKANCNFH